MVEPNKTFIQDKPITERCNSVYEKLCQARKSIERSRLRLNEEETIYINSALQWINSGIDELKYDTSI